MVLYLFHIAIYQIYFSSIILVSTYVNRLEYNVSILFKMFKLI